MSQSREMNYTCPYCHETFTIQVYDSVNANEDTDLREKALSGDLFRHECPSCHKQFMVQNPLIYTDREHKFVLWLSQNEVGNVLTKYAAPLAKQGFKLRRVSTIQEFIEKIEIFEDGMDDVAVELAKYDSFIEFLDNKKGKAEDVTSIEYQRTKDEVMKINIRMADKGVSFLIPVNMIEEELKAEKDLYEIHDEDFPLINADWILTLFQKCQGKV